jgi:hypothetical protein
VTGIALPALLRASHAKPWAECNSDAERLNVFNGFLVDAHLAAIFDRHFISFADSGKILSSSIVTPEVRAALGLSNSLRLKWINSGHIPSLALHRAAFHTISG